MSYLFNQIIVLYLCLRTVMGADTVKNRNYVFMVFWPKNIYEFIQYFGRAYVLQDVTLYIALKGRYEKVMLVRKKNLKDLPKNSTVFYSAVPFSRGTEMQGEYLYNYLNEFDLNFIPQPHEIRFWENKIFMHEKFEDLGIPHPKSIIVRKGYKQSALNELSFPVLSKIPNGNHSRGIVSHKEVFSLQAYLEKAFNEKSDIGFIIQEQMDITFDVRVVTIKDKVVYHYWRDKILSDSFISTSTSNGSALRIDILPQHIIDVCIESSKRLNLNLAAYDITFVKNGSNIHPFIFEVSPSFLLNPIPDKYYLNKPYKEYKKNYLLFNKNRIDQFIELKRNYVESI